MAVAELVVPFRERTTAKFDFAKRLPALDGLRGIAIVAVFLQNYAGGFIHAPDGSAHLGSAALRLLAGVLGATFGLGWMGVSLFFVLSGFLITGILYETRGDAHYYRNFYARRALRIFPIYYLFAFVLLVLGIFVKAHWRAGDLLFLVYLGFPAVFVWPSLLQISPAFHITHLWSLCVEEQFYMLWPWPVAKMTSRNSMLLACFGIVLASLGFRTVVWWLGAAIGNWSYAFLIGRMDGLAIGAAIAIGIRGPWRRQMQRCAAPAFTAAIACIATICWIRHSVDATDALMSTLGYSAVGLACGALILMSLKTSSWTQQLMSLDVLRIFGKYSYGFYLYHAPLAVVLSPMRKSFIAAMHSFWIGSGLHVAFCLLLNLSVAALSFHILESPILKMKRRFAYSRQ